MDPSADQSTVLPAAPPANVPATTPADPPVDSPVDPPADQPVPLSDVPPGDQSSSSPAPPSNQSKVLSSHRKPAPMPPALEAISRRPTRPSYRFLDNRVLLILLLAPLVGVVSPK